MPPLSRRVNPLDAEHVEDSMVALTWKSRMELIAEDPFTVDAMAIVTTCARLADYTWQKTEKGLRITQGEIAFRRRWSS